MCASHASHMASHRKLRYHRIARPQGREATGSGAQCNDLAADGGLGRQPKRASDRRRRIAPCSRLVQLFAAPSVAQEADRFSAAVKVDAGADTAVKAREAARVEGQRRALATIAERLSGGGAPVKPPPLGDKAITDLVASFEVANERMSAVRYIADYTFHFRPAETARVLGLPAAAASAAELSPKPAPKSGPPRAWLMSNR